FAYHSGYTAAAVNEVVVAGSSLVTIALEPGQTLAITNITQSPPLTTAQINAAGINVSDPVNNVVVNFTVALQIGTVVTPYVEIPMNPPPGSSYSFSGTAVATGAPSLPGGSVSFSATINQTPYGPQETWIIIPGAVTALKQFFEVSMYLVNNAVAPVPSDVQVQGLDATLGLPAGLGLPDLDGQPQSLTQYLGTLDAGSSTQATWIIRGDEPGTYLLSGSSSGDLHAFGMFSNTLNATATGRPFDVVLPRLRLDFITPQAVTAGVQFMPDFGVLVTNEGVATANLVRVSLKVDQLINCHPCLTQPSGTTAVVDGMGDIIELIAVLGDIEPGQSGLAEFCLIAEVTGQVINVETSIWSSATPSPSVTVSPSYPGNDQSCAIYSGIGEPPNAVALNVGYPGQLGEVLIDAPTHVGGSLVLAAGVYYEGIQPAEVFPGIWVGAGLAVVTLPPVAVHPQGNHFFFDVVPGYRDFSFLLQGVIVSPATPASYCATAAHEFRVRQ
ncbi:MAG: hypothetical protein KDB53_18910, partial [Planctomycetes bacterium]|nr:hypothetical protein [Planctomycetota bacterium]